MGEIGLLTIIRPLDISKRVEYCNSDFTKDTCDDLVTLYKHLVNFGPVNPEFQRVIFLYSVVDQKFGYAAPLLDLALISTEFSEAITTQFCLLFARGVTAMPRGLHARLCHAFLVFLNECGARRRHCYSLELLHRRSPNLQTIEPDHHR